MPGGVCRVNLFWNIVAIHDQDGKFSELEEIFLGNEGASIDRKRPIGPLPGGGPSPTGKTTPPGWYDHTAELVGLESSRPTARSARGVGKKDAPTAVLLVNLIH